MFTKTPFVVTDTPAIPARIFMFAHGLAPGVVSGYIARLLGLKPQSNISTSSGF
jgi:hypothetical protein